MRQLHLFIMSIYVWLWLPNPPSLRGRNKSYYFNDWTIKEYVLLIFNNVTSNKAPSKTELGEEFMILMILNPLLFRDLLCPVVWLIFLLFLQCIRENVIVIIQSRTYTSWNYLKSLRTSIEPKLMVLHSRLGDHRWMKKITT